MRHYFCDKNLNKSLYKSLLLVEILRRSVVVATALIAVIFSLCACAGQDENKNANEKDNKNQSGLFGGYNEQANAETERLEFDLENDIKNKKIAVVYFSEGDDVKDVAEKFAETFNADTFEIEPEVPYTVEDLDFENENSRVNLEAEFSVFGDEEVIAIEDYPLAYMIEIATVSEVEKEKISELPKIKRINVNKYNVIVLGYPIWKDDAPKVIYTFVGDLKNKIIVPFCSGEDMGLVDQYINNYIDYSNVVMSGKRFEKDVSSEELKEWMEILAFNF